MRDGLRVYDADTHVNPAAEVLEQYVDGSFRPRLADLAPNRVPDRVPVGRPVEGERQLHGYRIETKFYRRVLGEGGPHPTFTGRGGTWRGTQRPRAGVQDDQAPNRVKDMMTRAPMCICWSTGAGPASWV